MEGIKMSWSLPPGFRFYPTDEELIIHYLKRKVSSPSSTNSIVSLITDVDLYKFNPWELPDRAQFGDTEWFFFSPRDRKYPNGARPNRAAASGYWKATGTDKPILSSRGSQCIGVKKALVFYRGRPPKGSKTNWMMYEYRLLNDTRHSLRIRGSMRLDDWVLCRIRNKSNFTEQATDNWNNNTRSPPSYFSENFSDKDSVEKMNYFKDFGLDLAPRESEITDDLGHIDFQGATSSTELPNSSDGNSGPQSNMAHSLKETLETIKRVLSIGALDEQISKLPNNRACSLLPSGNLDSSNIFDVSSS